jgi:hypothetical protein
LRGTCSPGGTMAEGEAVRPPRRASGAAGASGLPCLCSNSGIEGDAKHGPRETSGDDVKLLPENILRGNHRRTAYALAENVVFFVERHGLERVGFLTLTFAENVQEVGEGSRRLHSLGNDVLAPRYGEWIRIMERQKSGRIHYHLLVNVGADIRSTFDFHSHKMSRVCREGAGERMGAGDLAEVEHLQKRFRRMVRGYAMTASPALRAEWAFWRATSRKYGFGRVELLPVMSTEEAVARYLGKYVRKHIEHRKGKDKGAKLVHYGGGSSRHSVRFGWLTDKARLWRRHLAILAEELSIEDMSEFAEALGQRWAWVVMKVKLTADKSGASIGDQVKLLRSEIMRTGGEL